MFTISVVWNLPVGGSSERQTDARHPRAGAFGWADATYQYLIHGAAHPATSRYGVRAEMGIASTTTSTVTPGRGAVPATDIILSSFRELKVPFRYTGPDSLTRRPLAVRGLPRQYIAC